jgi:hypothetical protein
MAAVRKVLAHLDFGGKGEIRNVVLGGAASRPSSPEVGAIFYNDSSNRVEYWDGTSWQTLAAEVFTAAAHDAHDHSAVASTIALNELGEPSGSVSFGGQRIVSVATPVASSDAATKGYVDSEVADEQSAREAADSALDSRLDAVEADIAALDVTYATNAELTAAVAAEETRALAAEGALDSRLDAAESDIDSLEGRMTTAELDIDNLESNLTSESNSRQAADSALDTRVTAAEAELVSLDGRLDTVEGQIAALDSTYATDAALATAVGNINATINAVVSGGQTANNAQNARLTALEANDVAMQTSINNVEAAVAALDTTYATDVALAAETSAREAADNALDTRVDALEARRYSVSFGDGTNTSFALTHNLGSEDVVVSVREIATGEIVFPAVFVTSANVVTVEMVSAPTANQYRVTVLS